jgi:competence protein ComFC
MLKALLSGLGDLIYPKICLSCKKKLDKSAKDSFICQGCWSNIKRNVPPFCQFCGRRLKASNISKSICPDCTRRNLHFDSAFSPCVYTGVIKDLIREFKYKNKDYLGLSLSRLMIEFIKEYNTPIEYMDFIVPIPLHKTKLREREFNQAQILSQHIAKEFEIDVLTQILLRTKKTKTQAELETHERFLNVKDSFRVIDDKQIRNKNILLVDDVLTTGATSSEAAKALKNSGANIVFVLTLAN